MKRKTRSATPPDALERERLRLMEIYRKLAPAEQVVVKLLAINWGLLGKSLITTLLRRVKLAGPGAVKSPDYGSLTRSGLLFSVRVWEGEKLGCNRLIVELIARESVLDKTFNIYVDLARMAAPLQKSHARGVKDEFIIQNEEELIRETRLGMYWRDEAYITSLFRQLDRHPYSYYAGYQKRWPEPEVIFGMVCANPFDPEWFEGLPPGIRLKALPRTLSLLAETWRCEPKALTLLQEGCRQEIVKREWRWEAAMQAIYRGDWQAAEDEFLRGSNDAMLLGQKALLSFLWGDLEKSIQLFREGLTALRRDTGKKKDYFAGPIGLFFILALQARNALGDMAEADKLLANIEVDGVFQNAYALLEHVSHLERTETAVLRQLQEFLGKLANSADMNPWVFWVGMLVLFRYQPTSALTDFLPAMDACRQQAEISGFDWLAAEMAGLIARVDGERADAKELATAFEQRAGIQLLIGRIQREEPWERALKAITNTIAKPREVREKKEKAVETRLAWMVYPNKLLPMEHGVEAREQARNAKGGWNKGKPLSLRRLKEKGDDFAFLTQQDLNVIGHIAVDRYSNGHYLMERGWQALVGHGAVFWKDSGAPLELVSTEPELRIKKKSGSEQVRIEFWPKIEGERKLVIAQDGLTRLKIIELKPEHRRLYEIIGHGLDAPLDAQERILASLSAVSSLVTIHSDIGGAELAAAESVEADPRPRIQLIPEGDGLRIAQLVRPFGEQGSYYAPGSGGSGLIAEIGGKRLQTQRDLQLERRLAAEALELCPSLGEKAEELQSSQWLTPDAETSLEVLLELHELGDKALVEWPQGEKFKMLGQAGLNRFSMKLQQNRDWFSVSGELKLDSGEILNMQRLLELTEGSRTKFIRLDENRFLALTDAFRKRLDDLRSYSEKHGKEQRVTPLALTVLEEIAEEVGEFDGDAAWRQQIERLRAAEQSQPRLPSTLQAELRDYQREGFEWLSRLAAWGVGACLADDMGLGKTLQAIALILARAGEGPSLVIAPTSVCFNWQNEVARFAPTLNVRLLGPGDRQQQVDSLQPLDLLICSYGLLQQESVGELLAGVRFRTIVLDEAQSIKNPATKRSQQAMILQGEFKLITTGTPLENHLGELWNLFRFINPGLLGSLESFNRRFAGPIERSQDRDARHRLKKLIQPFILRRTKSQVLYELPPRTEIELQVELSEQEATFYEAMRRTLLDELKAEGGPIEDKRFQVLAAITKLRRACCNPQLVAPGLGLASSKLELFGEVLEEILENCHKALVFSQFVDHLDIIRRYVEEKKIAYQYLDGQTPPAERKKRVEAFQSGQGDVFLISLKAGGVGLNLTAADYVIHMDPWWNPAVEDQASDRAHRIGQQRPVTVYRLVAKGTIEEQIVSLHRHKRDLADSLLEGGEMSGKIGAEELLHLMRGE